MCFHNSYIVNNNKEEEEDNEERKEMKQLTATVQIDQNTQKVFTNSLQSDNTIQHANFQGKSSLSSHKHNYANTNNERNEWT